MLRNICAPSRIHRSLCNYKKNDRHCAISHRFNFEISNFYREDLLGIQARRETGKLSNKYPCYKMLIH